MTFTKEVIKLLNEKYSKEGKIEPATEAKKEEEIKK